MSEIREIRGIHRRANLLAQEAYVAKLKGDLGAAQILYSQAYEQAKEVAEFYHDRYHAEPTRSVVLKNAAYYAKELELFREAERYAAMALAGRDVPEDVLDDLRHLLEDINLFRHAESKYSFLDSTEIQFSLTGNSVGYGMVKSKDFIQRYKILESIVQRTAERKQGKPYRIKGKINSAVSELVEAYLAVPRENSFAIKIRFGSPVDGNISLFPDNFPAQVVDDIMDNINLVNDERTEELQAKIGDENYYQNFISLISTLAPDGNNIKAVGLTAIRLGELRTLCLEKPGKEVRELLPSIEENGDGEVKQAVGTLRMGDAASNSIRIETETGKIKINVSDGLTDLVKIFFDESVKVVYSEVSNKKNILINLEPIR